MTSATRWSSMSGMNIGIIGSGNIGGTAAKLFADAGHDVAIANSRGPDSLEGLVREIGPRARAATVAEAASFGEMVLVAIPFGRYRELPPVPDGTILIDAMNYYPGRDGNFEGLDDDRTTSTELVAAQFPGARVVKAFNTMMAGTLGTRASRGPRDDRLVMFVAGDDADAKQRVIDLIGQIGFAAVDTGGLAEGGRRQQPGSPIYTRDLTPSEAATAIA
jgi:8-hydroxy-5-deazaflavin:NADPH oxidoreductase